jgi:hypothetical protein
MTYLFVDEKIEELSNHRRFIVCCAAFYQSRWGSAWAEIRKIGQLRKKRRLEKIIRLLEETAGLALLGYADIPLSMIPSGEIDGTDDVPQMTRSDNIWSQCVLFAVAGMLARLCRYRWHFSKAQLFYDPKSLKREHRDAFNGFLRKEVPLIARMHTGREIQFQRIEEVPKQKSSVGDALRSGIAVSHHLCFQSDLLIRQGTSKRIRVSDMTKQIIQTTSQFITGKLIADSDGLPKGRT